MRFSLYVCRGSTRKPDRPAPRRDANLPRCRTQPGGGLQPPGALFPKADGPGVFNVRMGWVFAALVVIGIVADPKDTLELLLGAFLLVIFVISVV
jgi:hypothetical protein